MFEPSGDLLTNGSAGVLKWPVQPEGSHGELRIGPPSLSPYRARNTRSPPIEQGQLWPSRTTDRPTSSLGCGRSRSGRSIAARSVSVSPDGQWLATGSFQNGGVTIWRLPDGARATKLPIDGVTGLSFSPDGKWLATVQPRSRLWEVGTWRKISRRGRLSLLFPRRPAWGRPGHQQGPRAGRDRDRPHAGASSSPDQHDVAGATFSPDGLAGRDDPRTSLSPRLGLAGHTPTAC